jgi:hypothetical protein
VDRAAVLAAQETPTALDRRALTGVVAVAAVAPVRYVTAIPFAGTPAAAAVAPLPVRRVVGRTSDIRSWFGFGSN